LKLSASISERTQQEGASAEEVNVIITKEKETIFSQLDQAIKNTSDKKVVEELTVAVEKSKTLITEQTVEAHAIGVQVITASDKKTAVEKLHTLTKTTEDKLHVVVSQENVAQVIQHQDKPKKDHHHTSAIIGGALAVGAAVAGAVAVESAIEHKHKKDQAQVSTTHGVTAGSATSKVAEVDVTGTISEVSENVQIADVKKADGTLATAVIVEGTVDKNSTVVIEEVKVTVFGWYKSLNERIAARLRQGGDNTKSDVERITKDAREELTVIIKETKDKAHKGLASDEKATAELEVALEKVQGSVLEQVTEVETIVKTTTEVDVITEKLTAATEKTKASINVHLDAHADVIHEHVEKKKSHAGAIAGSIAAGAAIVGGAIAKGHRDTEKKAQVRYH
jgi:hypothetical protein